MRIVSGTCKGRSIEPPRSFRARPTTDFAKENIFNVISNLYNFDGLSVLDLFSGTGSISYEFASRGASRVVAVEQDHIHYAFIKATATKLHLDAIWPIKMNAFSYLKGCKDKFDIIFADPPYDLDAIDALPDMIIGANLLSEDGIFIFEHSKSKKYSDHPNFSQHRSYGSVNFSIFELKKDTAPENK